MAYYNSYYPVTYQPYQVPQYQMYQGNYGQAQPQMNQQSQQSQPVQNYSPVINQSGIIWISGESEAGMYPVGPNSAVALWQKDGKTIYLKQADATGKPTMTVYDLVERTESPMAGQSESGKSGDLYATKEDLSAVVGVVKGFDEVIGTLRSEMDTMKSDLYGIAGKKKSPARKPAEVAEDE